MDTGAARSIEVTEVDRAGDTSARAGVVVALRGTVDQAGAPALRDRLAALLRRRRRVVADLSAATLADRGAVHVFADALAAAGGWPAATLLLAAPDPAFASALHAAGVDECVPRHPDVATALARVDERPSLVRDGWSLDAEPRAPRTARAHVRRVCAAWDVADEVCEAAEIVVTELVTNAVEHAASRSSVEVARRAASFRLEVRDWETSPLPDVALPPPDSARGRGLAMVAAVSTRWGVRAHPDGKTVWSELSS